MLNEKININVLGMLVAVGGCWAAGFAWQWNPWVSVLIPLIMFSYGMVQAWRKK